MGMVLAICLVAGGCSAATLPKPRSASVPEKSPRNAAQSADSPARMPLRPAVKGRPAPTAVCGHAIAVLGWRGGNATGDAILVCDPADNGLTGSGGHDWRPHPRALPVHYGRRRPSVVLLPSAPFTITGAIVVTSRTAVKPRVDTATAEGMPDLTQHFDDRDPGLCGPTSAADVLFAMAGRAPAVLPRAERGPSDRADAAVKALIAGAATGKTRDPASLAGRMGIAIGGAGATNQGIRDGIDAWLAEAEPGAWQVSLDWFDDTEKPRSAQQAFFQRLAATIDGGGGAILCMWPGSEFADGAVAEPTGGEPPAGAAATEPVEAGPQTPATAEPANGFPGRSMTRSAADAAQDARRALEKARRQLASGDAFEALERVGEAIEAVRLHAPSDAECRAQLDAARELAAEVESRAGSPRGTVLEKPTVFE